MPDRRKDRELHFASCRSMGHEWHHQTAIGVDDPVDGFRRPRPFGMSTGMVGLPSTCASCGTERVRWITRSGEVISRYNHPDGYSRHGEEKLSSQEWRQNYVATLFESFEKSVAKAPRKQAARREATS